MSPARAITVVTMALACVVATSGVAFAGTTPTTWAVAESPSTLWLLAVFVGGPLVLFLGIWALAAAVNAKSRNYVPTIPSGEIEKAGSHH